jgi:hypothetical protein
LLLKVNAAVSPMPGARSAACQLPFGTRARAWELTNNVWQSQNLESAATPVNLNLTEDGDSKVIMQCD